MTSAAQPRASFSGPVPWHRFVQWEKTDDGGFVCSREKFRLLVWPDKGPPAGFKGRVEYEGKMVGECVCLKPNAGEAVQAIQRALVKLAVFHGMPVEPVITDMIAPLLVDPTDTAQKQSRRVGVPRTNRVVVPGETPSEEG